MYAIAFFTLISICSAANITLTTASKGWSDFELRYANFDIFGYDGSHRIQTTYGNYGYFTSLRVGNQETYVTGFGPTTLDNIEIDTILENQENYYIKIIFNLTNVGNSDKVASVEVDSDVMIDNDDHATIQVYGEGRGFYMKMRTELYSFTFVGKNSPGVTDIDTYWFGQYSNRYVNRWRQTNLRILNNTDSGMVFAWQNRTVPAHGFITLSALIGVLEPTVPPDMNLTSSQITAVESDGDILFAGRIFSEDRSQRFTLFLTIDGNNNRIIASNIVSGELFSYRLIISETYLSEGIHTFTIWARDPQGGLSNAGVLTVAIFTSHSFSLNSDGVTEISEGETSLSLSGNGEIARHLNGVLVDLILSDIRLNPLANVTARQLVIARSLLLLGSSLLSAASGGYISFQQNVQILFEEVNGILPSLHLGIIPSTITLPLPSVFQITLPEGFHQQGGNHKLISGTNFDCESWKSKVNIPIGTSNTSLWCGSSSGTRVLVEGEEQVLYLSPISPEAVTSGLPPPTSLNRDPDSQESSNIWSIYGLFTLAIVGIVTGQFLLF
jgi:hypothetical protein